MSEERPIIDKNCQCCCKQGKLGNYVKDYTEDEGLTFGTSVLTYLCDSCKKNLEDEFSESTDDFSIHPNILQQYSFNFLN